MLPKFSVSDFIAITNQTFEYAFPSVEVEGEVASFKVNQGKFVFFDLKDSGGTIGCFMTVWQLRVPIEDGMKIIVTAAPKLTQWGKFSLTVQALRPSGEGSLKKSFDLLRAKLEAEGLFAEERKRPLPQVPEHVGVITSTAAAGYADFIKILDNKWGGLRVDVAHVQVQGTCAPDQMIRALKHFNAREVLPDVIVIIRGGGSADDLSCFNDELLVREIAASRVPTLVGVGHEIDVSLADLAADVRAATPSNAAQLLVPDRQEIYKDIDYMMRSLIPKVHASISEIEKNITDSLTTALETITDRITDRERDIDNIGTLLAELDPSRVLARGYALIRGEQSVGAAIEIETWHAIMKAKVESYDKK